MHVTGDAKCYLQHKCYAVIYKSINSWQTSKIQLKMKMNTDLGKKKSEKVIDKEYYYAFAHGYCVKTSGKRHRSLTSPFGCHPKDVPPPSETPFSNGKGASHKLASVPSSDHCRG